MADLPRYLAGAGMPDTALGVLHQSGWRFEQDEHGNTFAFSPDRRVIVAFVPEEGFGPAEGDRWRFAPRLPGWPSWEPVWVVRAYAHGDLDAVVWEAVFTSDTPAEFIAAFLVDLVRKRPLEAERDEPAPPALIDQ
ncbi:DUF317 domain-containing protein [Actinomadura sp. SCN-SB]|uniref:DUF317 domain-containing protein n=1 Tax=Actinomadura sp. SCN-SB TaxID=3373092 RepID=UPI003753E4BE